MFLFGHDDFIVYANWLRHTFICSWSHLWLKITELQGNYTNSLSCRLHCPNECRQRIFPFGVLILGAKTVHIDEDEDKLAINTTFYSSFSPFDASAIQMFPSSLIFLVFLTTPAPKFCCSPPPSHFNCSSPLP